MSDKPREFWITFQPYDKNPLGPCTNILKYVATFAHEYGVHVVEIGALRKVEAERDYLEQKLKSARKVLSTHSSCFNCGVCREAARQWLKENT